MTTRNFSALLDAKFSEKKHLCVGLDPVLEKIPIQFLEEEDKIGQTEHLLLVVVVSWMRTVVASTKEYAAAYKPNIAFFTGYGILGYQALKKILEFIRTIAPDVPVILDFKRADIGDTNIGSVREAFDDYGVDAVTINPFFGYEAMIPFLDRADKGFFILARTSNKGAGEFQDLVVPGSQLLPPLLVPLSLSEAIAYNVNNPERWNKNGNCGLVAGATNPAMMEKLRRRAGDLPFLVPGIGKQGGDLEQSVKAARIPQTKKGFLINVSSSINQATMNGDFSQAAWLVAKDFHENISYTNAT